MARADGEIRVDIKAQTGQFNIDIQKAATKAKSTLFKAFAFASGVAIGKGFYDFTTAAINAASHSQQTANRVKTVFPQMTQAVNAFAKNAMTDMGMTAGAAKNLTTQFGQMAQGMGMTESESFGMSTAMTKLAGDMAAFYGITTDEARSKLSGVFTGMTRGLKQVGVNITEANLQQEAYNRGIYASVSTMSQADLAALRLSYTQRTLANVSGYAARNINSWQGQTNLLNQQMRVLQTNVGRGFIAIALPVVQALNAVVAGAIKAAKAFAAFVELVTGRNLSDAVGSVGAVVDDLGYAEDEAAVSTDGLVDAQDNATEAAKRQDRAVKELNRTLAGFDKINKLSSNSADLGATSTTGNTPSLSVPSLGQQDLGLASLFEKEAKEAQEAVDKIHIPKPLMDAIEHLRSAWQRLSDVITGAFAWAYENILKPLGEWTLNELAPRLVEMLANAIETLAIVGEKLAPVFRVIWEEIFQPLFKFIGDVVLGALDSLNKGWADFNKTLDAADFTEFAENLRAVIKLIKDSLVKAWELAKAGGEALFDKVIKPLAEFFAGTFKKSAEVGKTAIDAVRKVFDAIHEAGAKFYDKALKPLADILTGAFKKGLDAGKVAIDALKKVFDAIHDAGAKFYDKVLKPIADFFGGLFKKNTDGAKTSLNGFKGIWDGLKSKTIELAQKGIDTVKTAASKAKEVWDGIKTKTVEIVGKAKDALGTAGNTLRSFWGLITGRTSTLTGEARDRTAAAGSALKAFWHDIKDKAATITGAAKDATGKAGETLKTLWSSIKDKTVTLTAKLLDNVTKIAEKVWDWWQRFTNKDVNLTANNKTEQGVSSAKQTIAGVPLSVLTAFAGVNNLSPMATVVNTAIKAVPLSRLTQFIGQNGVAAQATAAKNSISTVPLSRATRFMGTNEVKAVAENAVSWIKWVPGSWLSRFNGENNLIKQAKNTVEWIKWVPGSWLSQFQGQNALINAAKNSVEWIKWVPGSWLSRFNGENALISSAKNSFEWIKWVPRTWLSQFQGRNDVIAAAKNAVEWINWVPRSKQVTITAALTVARNGFNNAMYAIEAGLGRFGLSVSLPRFATGGYVGRNTPMLSVIGDNTREGEIVSPESKFQTMLDKAVQMGGGNAQTVALLGELITAVRALDTNVYLDGNDITRAVVSRVNKQTQTTGVSPIII